MDMPSPQHTSLAGCSLRVRGIVQGVGFRPTVWRLARQQGLTGKVCNDGHGVLIQLWGSEMQIRHFEQQLIKHCPPLARIDSIERETLIAEAPDDFRIENSHQQLAHTAVVPDAATCPQCLAETLDRSQRRYRYAFTNCTHCGPRLSIIRAIPYDRANTSMAAFTLCADCRAEYENPADRRFHAQPVACPACGPQLSLSPAVSSNTMANAARDTIDAVRILLQQGHIVAIKGLGGYHLACDAGNREAVKRLRQRKKRYAKPFALMARDLGVIRRYCHVSAEEAEALQSSAAPIVVLDVRQAHDLPAEIAPRQRALGFMLPYTPLHHVLLQSFDRPLVMTSGNVSDVPQCTEAHAAETKLAGIADYWLHHNRDIVNRLDDSVLRVVDGKPRLLRRARGYAPAPLPLPAGFDDSLPLLAMGGELKNTFCLIKDGQAIVSQHIGDLENADTLADYEHQLTLYQQLFDHEPQAVAIDAHPEYLSSKLGAELARQRELPLIKVQHHHAHLAACLGENRWSLNSQQVLAITLDGLGFGEDGTLWGGEFLLGNYQHCRRVASLVCTAMPGGAQAMREPWRNTYAQLSQHADWPALRKRYAGLELIRYLQTKPLATLDQMRRKGLNTPMSSSCGRLFDAVAAAIGICRKRAAYEGQAAIELEAMVDGDLLQQQASHAYAFPIETGADGLPRIHSRDLWPALLADLAAAETTAVIASRFHLGLAGALVAMVDQLRQSLPQQSFRHVALSGGVFQNRVLFTLVSQGLQQGGYEVLCHSRLPANDGGLSLGQALIALARHTTTDVED